MPPVLTNRDCGRFDWQFFFLLDEGDSGHHATDVDDCEVGKDAVRHGFGAQRHAVAQGSLCTPGMGDKGLEETEIIKGVTMSSSSIVMSSKSIRAYLFYLYAHGYSLQPQPAALTLALFSSGPPCFLSFFFSCPRAKVLNPLPSHKSDRSH